MDDILQAALEAQLDQEPLYVKAWKKWVNVRELDSDEMGEYMERSIVEIGSGKNVKRKPNYKALRPYLATLTVRYPSPDCPPPRDHPHYAEYPGAVDENGNYLMPPHPKAGELVFTQGHISMLKKRGSQALGQIADVAMRLSGLSDDEIEQKKEDSETATDWTSADLNSSTA